MAKRKKKDELYYVMSREGFISTAREKGWDLPEGRVLDLFADVCEEMDSFVDEWLEDNLSDYATEIPAGQEVEVAS